MAMPADMAVQGGPKVLPVFFKNSDVLSSKERPATVIEVCKAAEATAGLGSIDGAQKIQGLWRIYCLQEEGRQKLIQNKLSMRSVSIDIYDTNPFVRPEGESTYLAIHEIPLSYDNNVIKSWLETHGFPPLSPIKEQYARDENNKLTNFKTGSRFVYVGGDPSKIPDRAQIGLFTAKLWYPDMKKKTASLNCSNCLQPGHTKTSCTAPVVCLSCKQPGHKRGECELEALAAEELNDQKSQSTAEPTDKAMAKQVADLLAVARSMPPIRGGRGGRPRYGSHTTPRTKRTRSHASKEDSAIKKKNNRATPTHQGVSTFQQNVCPTNDGWTSDQTSEAESLTDIVSTVRKKGTVD